jgi:energy-coupling factor transporter ATP-binding protein EcfA2
LTLPTHATPPSRSSAMSAKAFDWARQLVRLRAELQRDVALISDLKLVQHSQGELERQVSDLDRQLERVESSAVILLVGSTGAGKSTLLNALAGTEIALASENRPTTSVPTVYAPEDADLRALLTGLKGPEPRVVRYPRGTAGTVWTEQVLIDAPDVNSIAKEHRETVRALSERADVLLVTLHRQSIVEDAAVSFLDDFSTRRRLLFALNRSDELTPKAREDLLAQIRSVAKERLGVQDPQAFAISAREALAGRGGESWSLLLKELERLVRDGLLSGVRRHNALGSADQLGRFFEGLQRGLAEDLGALHPETKGGLTELIAKVDGEVQHRLGLRRAELVQMLVSEAGKRWDGPGGWALRAGAWATVSTGLGLFLARRNPLAAAGVAAGGALLGKVRDDQGRAGFETTTGLLPEEGELRAWTSASLASARLRAGRLCGDPAHLDVPGHERISAELEGAMGESWTRLLRRDLPAAADRSVPPALRFFLDLPVYGLAGWILYRAGDGFLRERYVGLDFLLNGLLLTLALVFVVRLFVRFLVARRARGLLSAVAQHAQERLERLAQELAEPVEQQALRRSEALARLAHLPQRWRAELGQ